MNDLLLTPDGDLAVSEFGDISLTDSVRQAVRIRLMWFLAEWRFAPMFGVPYFEEILVKNPNAERLRGIIRDKAMTVDGVLDVRNISVAIDKPSRKAVVRFEFVTTEGAFLEELTISI